MTNTTPSAGNAPPWFATWDIPFGSQADLVRARVNAFATEFGTDRPTLPARCQRITSYDALIKWAAVEGCSIDWVFFGDPRPLIRFHRHHTMAGHQGFLTHPHPTAANIIERTAR